MSTLMYTYRRWNFAGRSIELNANMALFLVVLPIDHMHIGHAVLSTEHT